MSFSVSRTFKKYVPYEQTPKPDPTLQTPNQPSVQPTVDPTTNKATVDPSLPQVVMSPGTVQRGQVGNRLSVGSGSVADMY